MTTSVSKPLSQIEKVFKDLFWDPLILAALTYLRAYVPFFALPGVKQITDKLVSKLTDWIFEMLKEDIDVGVIKFKNSDHREAFDTASLHLQIVLEESGADSDEYKKARADAVAALSKFTRVNQ
jgi:hypothetical protein